MSFLLQAAIVAILFILFAWAAFESESLCGDFGVWIFIGLFLPAPMICEGLGLRKLSFLGSSSIPEPALWCAMIFVAGIYGLVLVGAIRKHCVELQEAVSDGRSPATSEMK